MGTRGGERWVWLGLGLIVVGVMAAGIWSLRGHGGGDGPPAISTLPPFELVERSGRTVSRNDLAGQPWVADFIFTQCSGVCPALSTRMAEVQRRMQEQGLDGRLVSFSVDPTRDTPAVLRDYAARFGADPERWWFVTGQTGALYDLIGKGFRLSVAERSAAEAQDGGELITHSDRFVLVDGSGVIRGYYHGTEPESVDAVLRDLAAIQPPRR